MTEPLSVGRFLRSRRERLSPADVGMTAFPGPRRVKGLRREEVAFLAGMSTEHYSRIEQDRQANLTDTMLDAIGRALRLDEVELMHLRDLADPSAEPASAARQVADPGLVRILSNIKHIPALLLGRNAEVLAYNQLLTAVLQTELALGSSLNDWLFRDPDARTRIVNWADFAARTVASMRFEIGQRPRDRQLRQAITRLRQDDPDVERWWNEHQVQDYTGARKTILHPNVVRLDFDIELVVAPQQPDQHLILYTVEPGSPTANVLSIVGSYAESLG